MKGHLCKKLRLYLWGEIKQYSNSKSYFKTKVIRLLKWSFKIIGNLFTSTRLVAGVADCVMLQLLWCVKLLG